MNLTIFNSYNFDFLNEFFIFVLLYMLIFLKLILFINKFFNIIFTKIKIKNKLNLNFINSYNLRELLYFESIKKFR